MEHADDMRSLLENYAGSAAHVPGRVDQWLVRTGAVPDHTDRRVEMIGTGVGAVGGRKPDEEVSAVPHRA